MLEWLPRLYETRGRSVAIHLLSDPKLENILERAVRFGQTMFLKGSEKVDPVCIEILKRRYTRRLDGSEFVRIGQKSIEVHPDFALLLVLADKRQLNDEDTDRLSVVNFSANIDGLEGPSNL